MLQAKAVAKADKDTLNSSDSEEIEVEWDVVNKAQEA